MYEPFEAKVFDHYSTGSWFTESVVAEVLPQEATPSMRIRTPELDIYITKQQAMAFFNLKEV